jgi:hypothetical protein
MARSGSTVRAARGWVARRALVLVVAWVLGPMLGLLLPAPGPARADGWVIECVDCPKDFDGLTDHSLRLDAAGHPHIAYGQDHLYYAWYDGVDWHYETVDRASRVGTSASLALDVAGRPHISYCDFLNEDLKYARWTGSTWEIQTVDSEGDVGDYSSLALDADGRPHISYDSGWPEYDLKYARWTGSAWDVQIVDSEGAYLSSLALDADGLPAISYHGRDGLKFARWTGTVCLLWTVDSEAESGRDVSLALDRAGRPHISYRGDLDLYNHTDLKYARWTGSAWEIQTVDSAEDGGWRTSLALDAAGRPCMSYIVGPVGDYHLNYAR